MPQLIRHLPHQEKVALNTSIVSIAMFTDFGKASIAYGGGFVGFSAGTADIREFIPIRFEVYIQTDI
ncbi:uncharacterized protein Bfra_009004 [Botrytis fragariae]|uniref:Uncharacterized protein n=1 Tax=Botrytis fragariae TaxID=1964551 RepID=A0A8H6AQY0_9HELO|nr:uncharacterized protein Bfra_009004 [Botrytis fragariae]KAF5871977.1 hypothetical protein Bfra_009004 [Botrytis fragariae]